MAAADELISMIDKIAKDNYHKSKYRVFIPTPPHTETVHLDPIRESDTYGGWREWMEKCKGCTNQKLHDWFDSAIKDYKQNVKKYFQTEWDNWKLKADPNERIKTVDERKAEYEKEFADEKQEEIDDVNKECDDYKAACEKVISDNQAKRNTKGAVYNEKELADKDEENRKEIEENEKDRKERLDKIEKDHAKDSKNAQSAAESDYEDAVAEKEKAQEVVKEFGQVNAKLNEDSNSLKPIFDFSYTKDGAEKIYSGYCPGVNLVDKYTGNLSPDLETGNTVVGDEVTVETVNEAGETETSTEMSRSREMTNTAWEIAYQHNKHSKIKIVEFKSENVDMPSETADGKKITVARTKWTQSEKTLDCPEWCETKDNIIRGEQDVKVIYAQKAGNKFSYKVRQASDKDSDYYQYFWFINDNMTDSLAYRSDMSIQRAGMSKNSKINDEGVGKALVTEDPFIKLINAIPSIKVMEYQPLMNIAELINNVTSIFGMGMRIGEGAFDALLKGKDTDNESALKKFFDLCTDFKNGAVKNILDKFEGDKPGGKDDAEFLGTFKLPYIMYKHALHYVTLNTYEFPYFGNNYMVGGGKHGWADSTFAGGFGKMFGSGFEELAKSFNINITTRPMFNMEGNGEPYPAVEFELNLFNYNLQALVHNFLLVNTLVPNNMWIQRGIFQQGSCLYDIQIPGRIRFFCCKADVSVEYAGIARVPPNEFFNEVKKHITKEFDIKEDAYNSIRVPDAYKVKISFQSLIPNNFNTYLFGYYEHNKVEEATLTIEENIKGSGAGISPNFIDAVSKGMQQTWDYAKGQAMAESLDANSGGAGAASNTPPAPSSIDDMMNNGGRTDVA